METSPYQIVSTSWLHGIRFRPTTWRYAQVLDAAGARRDSDEVEPGLPEVPAQDPDRVAT